MVKLTLNLKNKNVFFFSSGLCLLFMFYQINVITSSIDIKAIDIIILFFSMICATGLYWIPFQYNEKFTY